MLRRRELFAIAGTLFLASLATPIAARSAAIESPGGTVDTFANGIHPDCFDHQQRRFCTGLVREMRIELDRFNEAFSPPDVDQLAAFYHENAILYGGNPRRFFRGIEEIKGGLLTPLVAGITSARVDSDALHFQVINPDLIILYGSPTTTVTLPNGASMTLPALTQTHTWIREGRDPNRPFQLLTDHNVGEAGLSTTARATRIV